MTYVNVAGAQSIGLGVSSMSIADRGTCLDFRVNRPHEDNLPTDSTGQRSAADQAGQAACLPKLLVRVAICMAGLLVISDMLSPGI